jgi:signal transduction histidine kinase
MLRRLRFQLTVLYSLVAIGLVVLISFSAYSLLGYYFQNRADLALRYKMAAAFRQYGLTPPSELAEAEQNWQENKAGNDVQPTRLPPTPISVKQSDDEGEEHEEEGKEYRAPIQVTAAVSKHSEEEEHYDPDLAAIYILPANENGDILPGPNLVQPPFLLNQEASQAARLNGSDLRTTVDDNGVTTRLLTYRLDNPNGPVFLQMGRTLVDQQRVLNQFLYGLLLLGCASSVLLGLGSWWLSGQTLLPAQRSWDQQQVFISNASHELRTPLTLIKASAEVMRRGQLDETRGQLVDDILGECDYMNRLVEDLLLLSRLDTQRLQLARIPVSLPELLEEIAQQAKKLVAGKSIAVESGAFSGAVWGDPARLRQVLLILLDNAIRFTPDGGIICLETLQKRKTWQIMVSDNGKGIAPEHLPHIFERFYQANPTDEGQARGNGLGLSIAKGIVQALNGNIHVQSWAGKGTRMIVELPAANEPPGAGE